MDVIEGFYAQEWPAQMCVFFEVLAEWIGGGENGGREIIDGGFQKCSASDLRHGNGIRKRATCKHVKERGLIGLGD